MPYSNYPHGFADGVTVRNIPVNYAISPKANIWWVDSVNGSDGNKGNSTYPFATLAYAITKASAGDMIYLAAGHAESIIAASGINLNVVGITVVFLGQGSRTATITFSTVVGASLVISAANVTLINPRFVAGIDALTGPISITGASCSIISGSWYDAPAKAATKCIVAATTATELKICGWKFVASTTGTQKVSNIEMTAVGNAEIRDAYIDGDFSTANINNATTACANLRLENLVLKNSNATPKPGIVIQAATTGQVKNVDIRIASGGTYVSSVAALNWDSRCLGYHADGVSGTQIGTAP